MKKCNSVKRKLNFNQAIKYSEGLEEDFKLAQHITLLRYLKASADIGNNLFGMSSKAALMAFLKLNRKSSSGWNL